MPSLEDFERAVKDGAVQFQEDELSYKLIHHDKHKVLTILKQYGMEFSVRRSEKIGEHNRTWARELNKKLYCGSTLKIITLQI